jgi:hypothetical protein
LPMISGHFQHLKRAEIPPKHTGKASHWIKLCKMLENNLLHIWQAGGALQKCTACEAFCWKRKLCCRLRKPHIHNSVSSLVTFHTPFVSGKGSRHRLNQTDFSLALSLLKIQYHQSSCTRKLCIHSHLFTYE